MAITFHQEPNTISPSGNPLTYVFSSNQVAQQNFSYIVETYVDGAKIQEERIFPEVGAYAHRDISEAVDNVISTPKILPGLVNESGTTADIKIKVIENYGNPAQNQGSLDSTTTKAFRGRVSNNRFSTIDFDADWRLQRWLNNHPTGEVKVLRSQNAVLSMIGGFNSQLSLRFYDSNDDQIFLHQQSAVIELWQINVSQENLLSDTAITQAILDQTEYFTVELGSADVFRFVYAIEDCKSYSLFWMNEYGSFDTFVFEHANNRTGEIERISTYKKQFGKWSGNTYVYDSNDSGDIDFAKTKRDSGRLVSGYISETVQNWLVELYNSPFTLITYIDGSVTSVRVTKSSFNYEQERFEDLINESVDYKHINAQKSLNL